jgi:hypothetical protein
VHLFLPIGTALVVVPLTLTAIWWPRVGDTGFMLLAPYTAGYGYGNESSLMWLAMGPLAVGALFLLGGGAPRYWSAQSWIAILVPLATAAAGRILWW